MVLTSHLPRRLYAQPEESRSSGICESAAGRAASGDGLPPAEGAYASKRYPMPRTVLIDSVPSFLRR